MRGLIRTLMAVVLAAAAGFAGGVVTAHAQGRRDADGAVGGDGPRHPVAFQGGGPHAVVLLDAFNGAPDVSNWVTAGNAMNAQAVRASRWWPRPVAHGACTPTGSRTAASSGRRPRRRIAQLAGRQQGARAGWPRDRRRGHGRHRRDDDGGLPSRSLSLRRVALGLPDAVEHDDERRDHRGAGAIRRRRQPATCGPATAGPGKWHDPDVHVQLLADNNTRLWFFSPSTTTCTDVPRDDRLLRTRPRAAIARSISTNRSVGGGNGHFDFPAGGTHDWERGARSWGDDGELATTIR